MITYDYRSCRYRSTFVHPNLTSLPRPFRDVVPMKGRPPRKGATKARLAIRQAIQAIKPPRRTGPAATAPRVAPAASPIPPLTRSDALSDLASDTTQCMSNSSFLSELQQSSSSSSVLLAAVSDVVTNNTSIRRAAVVHGCPRTTLH